jgi:hypothetical protein
VHFFGDRIIAARLQLEDMVGKPLIIVLVSAYAPHSGSTLEEKEAFAGNLQACINICGPDEILIMGIDANASLGTRSAHDKQGAGRDRVRGTHGIKDENEAGKKLHMLLGVHELCAASTFFQKRRYETWYHPGANWRGFQIDHFIVRQNDMKRVRDAGAMGWRGVDSDHYAVGLRLNLARNLKNRIDENRGQKRVWVDRSLLQIDGTRDKFKQAVTHNLNLLRNEHRMDGKPPPTQLTMLEHAMKIAREEVLPSSKRRNPNWYQARQQQLDPLVQDRNAKQDSYNRSCGDPKKKRRTTESTDEA